MDKEILDHYIRAGEVIQEAREKAREVAIEGTELRVIANEIEALIRDQGLEPAFPVNLSINDEAAHYTPSRHDERVLEPDDVLKIDIGAHSEGYIADTALTVNPSGKHQDMIDAVENVLENTLDFIEPGKTVGELGGFIESQIPGEYSPVVNLTGHYLGRYTQHAGVSIPNVDNASGHVLEKGDAFAVEPFITTGAGKIKNGKPGNIYKLEHDRSVRGRVERQLLGRIKNFNGLPFTTRWFDSFSGREKMAMKKLVDSGIVHSYPVLREVEAGLVAQAEHTVVLGEDGKVITTRR